MGAVSHCTTCVFMTYIISQFNKCCFNSIDPIYIKFIHPKSGSKTTKELVSFHDSFFTPTCHNTNPYIALQTCLSSFAFAEYLSAQVMT